MSKKFCVVSAREAEYLHPGNLPDCRTHLHMSAREAREWLDTEYGPERMVPCKYVHTGQQAPGLVRERRTQAQLKSFGSRTFLIIEHATSPQTTGGGGGLVMVTWQKGLPPDTPIVPAYKQVSSAGWSNGYPKRATSDGTELALVRHRCQEL